MTYNQKKSIKPMEVNPSRRPGKQTPERVLPTEESTVDSLLSESGFSENSIGEIGKWYNIAKKAKQT
jgi:hypothetical protein